MAREQLYEQLRNAFSGNRLEQSETAFIDLVEESQIFGRTGQNDPDAIQQLKIAYRDLNRADQEVFETALINRISKVVLDGKGIKCLDVYSTISARLGLKATQPAIARHLRVGVTDRIGTTILDKNLVKRVLANTASLSFGDARSSSVFDELISHGKWVEYRLFLLQCYVVNDPERLEKLFNREAAYLRNNATPDFYAMVVLQIFTSHGFGPIVTSLEKLGLEVQTMVVDALFGDASRVDAKLLNVSDDIADLDSDFAPGFHLEDNEGEFILIPCDGHAEPSLNLIKLLTHYSSVDRQDFITTPGK